MVRVIIFQGGILMIQSYKAGYYTGRVFTKLVKYYLAGKVVKKHLRK